MKKLILIDGTFYIFRAYYGMHNSLTNKNGDPTGAVYLFKQMLIKALDVTKPDYVAVAFDLPTPTFRHEIYAEYKGNRDTPPDDLIAQIKPIYDLIDLMPLTRIVKERYEADDIIGTLCKQFEKDVEVLIISADKDLTQLVTDKTHMWDPMRDKIYTPQTVQDKYNVTSSQIPDYLALVGDTSDNIPGAAGIGPKGATKLLNEYFTIEAIYENIESITPVGTATKLRKAKDNVFLSKQLTPIAQDVPLNYTLEDLARKPIDQNGLSSFYQTMNFKADALLPSVEAQEEKQEQATWDYDAYKLIQTKEQLTELIAKLAETKQAAIDLETTNILPLEATIVGISFAIDKHQAFYIPTGHVTEETQLDCNYVLEKLSSLFEDKKRQWIGQNIKYDMLVLSNYNIDLKGEIQDTMIQAYLLNSSDKYSLDYLSQKYLNHETIAYSVATKEYKGKFEQVPLQEALRYAAEDSDATWQLYQVLYEQIKTEKLLDLYENIEMPLCRVLTYMEANGTSIDTQFLADLKNTIQKDTNDLINKIYQAAGEEFNINSPQQLSVILFEKLAIQEFKKKRKTGYATDAKTLEKLAPRYPIASYLMEYRTYMKLINTYLDVLPEMLNTKTNRVHTTYSQTVTATGRLSSVRPNLQNIPIRSKFGSQIRSGFIAKEGKLLLSADYSQIELRILAHLSQEENLISVYQNNGDIHRETAAAMYKCDLEEVTTEQRRNAKAINFGVVYGMGSFSLAQELGVPKYEAQNFIDIYFAKYPRIQTYMEEVINLAKEQGYVETILQRRRFIPDINAKNQMQQAAAKRVAFNTCVQGSAADLMKKAMISIYEAIVDYKNEITMIMQIHDELVFEIQEDKVEKWQEIIVNKMETSLSLSVPLQADSGFGKNWLVAH